MPRGLLAPALILVCALTSPCPADNWPNWRGPAMNGVAPGQGFPLNWSKTDNVLWKVKLPGKGASTPVVWDGKIIITCGVQGENVVLCLDSSGQSLWQSTLGKERPAKHKKASGSNPSAVVDGQHVVAYFKSGDCACLDMNGKTLWHHNLQEKYGEDTLWWDLGTSPVLTRDCVVLTVMQTGPSYLVAFDRATGQEVWKQDRNLNAPSEAAQSYSTPIVTTWEGREVLVVLGADHVTCHDAASGKELWRVGGLNPTGQQFYRSIASPVISDGVVVAPYARGEKLWGIRMGGSGDVTKTHVLWTKEHLGTDVPTPAAVDGKVYLLTDKGEVDCLDVQTGRVLWSGQPEKNRQGFSASPILADGKLYLMREDGKCFVLAADDEYKLLATNELADELVVASPVFVDHRLLIRTSENLYCVGR